MLLQNTNVQHQNTLTQTKLCYVLTQDLCFTQLLCAECTLNELCTSMTWSSNSDLFIAFPSVCSPCISCALKGFLTILEGFLSKPFNSLGEIFPPGTPRALLSCVQQYSDVLYEGSRHTSSNMAMFWSPSLWYNKWYWVEVEKYHY